MPERKQPVRSCIACRMSGGKERFVRIVKTPEGSIEVDLTGKRPGRGTYICPTKECVALALKKKSIEKGLRRQVPEQVVEEIRRIAEDNKDAQSTQAAGYDGST